ncbi:MAG: hypothetical protein KBC21_02600 [Candidatus Pacebacteria bacterium]|nr:hypothetical protein [Candidatus Paceibacterota bacterium]
MLKLFFLFELKKIVKYFSTKTLAKLIVTLMFLCVFFFVGYGIYFFFISGFRYISFESEPDSKLALALFLYEVFLLVLAIITMFSATVSGVFNLYRGAYNNWFISSPAYNFFPKVVFLKSLFTSLLPFLILFIPATFAFNKTYGLGSTSLLAITLSVILFLAIINSLTLSALLFLTLVYYKLTQKVKGLRFSLGGLVRVIIATVSLFTGAMWAIIKSLDLVQVFKADIESESVSVTNIAGYFDFLPTHPFAMELLSWQNNDQALALYYFAILGVCAVGSLFVWWKFSPVFYQLWQKFQEGEGASLLASSEVTRKGFVYRFNGSQTAVLFKKEMLSTSRNFKGVLWFVFLLTIWFLQIGTNTVLGFNIGRHQSDITLKIAILQSLQFIIAIYFICSFSLRFVFPAFSVEKRTAWILGSAPLNFRKIFFGKYFFYVTSFTILGASMSYVTISVINIPLVYSIYTIASFVIATISIVTLALSFGVIFPNNESDDPEVITTSMSGLFFTAFSLVYGALIAWALYTVLSSGNSVPLIGLLLLSIISTFLLLQQTPYLVKKISN